MSNLEITFKAYRDLSSFFSTKNTLPKKPLPKVLKISKSSSVILLPSGDTIVSVFYILFSNSFFFLLTKSLNFS